MAKAFLISPETRTIEPVDVHSKDAIAELIGYPTLETDRVGDDGDTLFFDEECFIRGASGRFQLDKLIPVAGKGVVVGVVDDAGLADVKVGLDELSARTRFD
jgi:hypothetical protein